SKSSSARNEPQEHHRRDTGKDCQSHCVIRQLWFSGISRRQLRPDCLCERLAAHVLHGCFYLRAAQQSADGLLSPVHHRQGRAAPWLACAAGRYQSIRQYLRGLNRRTAEIIAGLRPFSSIDDLARRVPQLSKNEMEKLAGVGALNSIG